MDTLNKINETVGIDVSKRSLECVRLKNDDSIERLRCKTDQAGLSKLINWINKTDLVVMETGSSSSFLAKKIQAKTKHIIILDSRKLQIISQTVKKTDREDALKLARLAKRFPVEELPTISIPTEKEETYRELVSLDAFLIEERASFINKLHGLFVKHGIFDAKRSHMQNKKVREQYIELLPTLSKNEANILGKFIDDIKEQLRMLEEQMRELLKIEAEFTKIAFSIPGIGEKIAFTLLAYIGDCSRFETSSQVSAYAGLTPRVNCSGEQNHYGRIIAGCQPIKRLIIQAAWSHIRSKGTGPLKVFYERLYQDKGKKKTAIATARKMIVTFFAMMKNKTLYSDVNVKHYNLKLKSVGLNPVN